MATNINVTWVQGQDLDIKLIYKEGATVDTTTVIDLSSGYSVRMDIIDATGARLYTFNSAVIPDVDPIITGSQPDNVTEAVLSSGAGGTPNITISVARSLTLPTTGELYNNISATPPKLTFFSDIFLRNTGANKQWKIATLTITVEKSYTLWP